jgi:hypothetical protein
MVRLLRPLINVVRTSVNSNDNINVPFLDEKRSKGNLFSIASAVDERQYRRDRVHEGGMLQPEEWLYEVFRWYKCSVP